MTNNASAVILPDVLNLSYTSNRWYGASRAAGTINLPGGVNYAYCRLLRFSEGAAYLSVIDAESKRQYVKMWNDVVGWGDYSEIALKDDLYARTSIDISNMTLAAVYALPQDWSTTIPVFVNYNSALAPDHNTCTGFISKNYVRLFSVSGKNFRAVSGQTDGFVEC